MKFSNTVKVFGIKQSIWQMDNRSENCCVLYVEMPISANNDLKAFGTAVGEFKIGHSDDISLYESFQFPFEAKGDFEMVFNGKKQNLVLNAITPLNSAKKS